MTVIVYPSCCLPIQPRSSVHPSVHISADCAYPLNQNRHLQHFVKKKKAKIILKSQEVSDFTGSCAHNPRTSRRSLDDPGVHARTAENLISQETRGALNLDNWLCSAIRRPHEFSFPSPRTITSQNGRLRWAHAADCAVFSLDQNASDSHLRITHRKNMVKHFDR